MLLDSISHSIVMLLIFFLTVPPLPQSSCQIKQDINRNESKFIMCWGDAYFKSGKVNCCKRHNSVLPICCKRKRYLTLKHITIMILKGIIKKNA